MNVETLVGPSIDAGPGRLLLPRDPSRDAADRKCRRRSKCTGGCTAAPTAAGSRSTPLVRIRGGDGQGEHRPLAIFRVGQRMYWLTMLIGYEGLGYAIDDVARGSVRRLVTARDGGC